MTPNPEFESLVPDQAFSRQGFVVACENAPQAFHAGYRKEEAEDGWRQLLAWFKKHGM